ADAEVLELRRRQMRNFVVTLFVAQGVPMLGGGDELGRTQRGNNNAYCQDNEVSWYDWDLDETAEELLAFVRAMVSLRRDHPVFLNGDAEPVGFRLPHHEWATQFELLVDTSGRRPFFCDRGDGMEISAGAELDIEGRSLVVLRKTA